MLHPMSDRSERDPFPPVPLETRARDLGLAVEPATFLAVLEASGPVRSEDASD